jgi:Cdc6-like AAA superfamily ATPase
MYGLAKEYFTINPKTEFQVFFAREEEFKKFYQDLMGSINSGRVPRYVVFGLFGVGKTHFLLHLKHWIAEEVDAIYIETPSSHRRTSFVEFYRTIVSALGRKDVIDLLKEALMERNTIRSLGFGEDLIYVIENAVKAERSFVLWKFLTGEKLKAAEAEELEAVRSQLSDEDAVGILKAISFIYEKTRRKPLLLLVDEFENTAHIGGDARTAFVEAMRSLVDESSRLGVIFALTSRSLSEMPAALYEEPVKRRIGLTNYIMFQEYKEDELEEFMRQAIKHRRYPNFDAKEASANLQTSETVDVDTYPFTKEALTEIARSVILFKEQQKIEAVRPKEALEIMDKSLRVGITRKLPFIGKDTILEVRDEVVEALRL